MMKRNVITLLLVFAVYQAHAMEQVPIAEQPLEQRISIQAVRQAIAPQLQEKIKKDLARYDQFKEEQTFDKEARAHGRITLKADDGSLVSISPEAVRLSAPLAEFEDLIKTQRGEDLIRKQTKEKQLPYIDIIKHEAYPYLGVAVNKEQLQFIVNLLEDLNNLQENFSMPAYRWYMHYIKSFKNKLPTSLWRAMILPKVPG